MKYPIVLHNVVSPITGNTDYALSEIKDVDNEGFWLRVRNFYSNTYINTA